MPENYLLVGLIEQYSGILLDSNGSIQPEGIRMVFEMEDIEFDSELVSKILFFITSARMTQRKKT